MTSSPHPTEEGPARSRAVASGRRPARPPRRRTEAQDGRTARGWAQTCVRDLLLQLIKNKSGSAAQQPRDGLGCTADGSATVNPLEACFAAGDLRDDTRLDTGTMWGPRRFSLESRQDSQEKLTRQEPLFTLDHTEAPESPLRVLRAHPLQVPSVLSRSTSLPVKGDPPRRSSPATQYTHRSGNFIS